MNSIEQTIDRPCPRILSALPQGARLALALLDRLQGGALAIALPDGQQVRVGRGAMVAHWTIRSLDVFDAALARGDIGLAESWMEGQWETDNLTGLMRLLVENREVLGQAVYGRLIQLIGYRVWHFLRANTRGGSRRNIEAHYDLGNDFYALWLDPSMTYSAAVFASPDESLEAAQLRKYRRILDRLEARPGETILEVGCGWGGFAEVAAREYGCRVLGITLSPSQLAFARERAERGGYADLVQYSLCDYRDVRGSYRHIVSIEMIEAVGERYWPTYFGQLSALLAPGGRCVIQAITMADHLFGRYRRGTDFIQRYIFPGGMLPSPSAVRREASRAGLTVSDDFAFGRDYARTLKLWHESFLSRLGSVREQGFSERFIRMWRFYLSYCEAGFEGGDIDVHHYELRR